MLVPRADALPLGSPRLPEYRRVTTLTRGVVRTEIVRGNRPAVPWRIPVTSDGPWRINIVSIDRRRAAGRLRTSIGARLSTLEKTSTLAQWSNALVAMNASFFSLTSNRRYPGGPVGLTVLAGAVLSSQTGTSAEQNAYLDAATKRVRFGRFRWSGQVTPRGGGQQLTLDDINREPAVPTACRARRDPFSCEEPGTTVRFTPHFAARTPSGPGAEVVFNRDGCVAVAAPARGVRLGVNQWSIQATGAAARRVLETLGQGCVRYSEQLRTGDREPLRLTSDVFAVTGRYRLLDDGEVVAPAGRGSLLARNPRSILGTTSHGDIRLITIDGRSVLSVGATPQEAAQVAKAVGVANAINLDGGGSTTLAIRGRVVNTVSGSAERAVSDAIVLAPR